MGVNAIGAAWMQTQSITSSQWQRVDWTSMTTLWQLVANVTLVSKISCRMNSYWKNYAGVLFFRTLIPPNLPPEV